MIKMERHENEKECSRVPKKIFNISSIFILLKTRNLRRRCLIIFYTWFVASSVYFGLIFSGRNIEASPYLVVFCSGLTDLVAVAFVCWTLKRFGRRTNLCAMFITCGAACLLILAVPKELVWLNIALTLVGKLFNAAGFGLIFVYTAELVPTKVRNVAMGASSMCARIGSAITPFIVDFLGDVHYVLPSTIFGLLSVASGLLALLLPETRHRPLLETIEEVEAQPK